MQNKFFKKSIIILLIFIINLVTFASCSGGSFPMTRRSVKGLFDFTKDQSKSFRFFKCAVAFIPGPIMMIAALFLDFVWYNSYEFWTDEAVGVNYDKNGKCVKSFSQGGYDATLTYTDHGKKLYIDVTDKSKNTESFVLLKEQPNKIFKEINGELKEIGVTESQVGSKVLLQSTMNGDIKSSKVVDSKEYSKFLSKF